MYVPSIHIGIYIYRYTCVYVYARHLKIVLASLIFSLAASMGFAPGLGSIAFLARTQLGHCSVTTWLHVRGRWWGSGWLTVLNSFDGLGLMTQDGRDLFAA